MSAVLVLEGVGPATKCQAANYHSPAPIRFVWHHILPQEAGGKTAADNLAQLCDSCFPCETAIDYGDVQAASRRHYVGPLVELVLDDGRRLPATPNHPILTANGWALAGLLQQGEQLVAYRRHVEMAAKVAHVGRVPSLISEVFDSLRVAAPMRLPGAVMNFHGERPDSNVDVVAADRQLPIDPESAALEFRRDFCLSVTYAKTDPLPSYSSLGQTVDRTHCPAQSILRGTRECSPLGGAHPRIPVALCSAQAPTLDTGAIKQSFDSALTNPSLVGESYCGFAGEVSLHQIVGIRWREFSGHVFNLGTSTGAYTANGIIVHNCHYATHAILYQLAHNNGQLTTLAKYKGTARYALALQGYQQAAAAGLLGKIPNEGGGGPAKPS